MIEFNTLESIGDISPTAVALGNFDGIHLGHQALIACMTQYAKREGKKSAVFTFANHPRNFISGESVVRSIVSPKEKYEIIRSMGVDYMFNLPFDDSFTSMDPEVFIHKLLLRYFRADAVFCGFNFRFGKRAAGNTTLLKQFADQDHFFLEVIEPFKVDDVIVSSTEVRKAIQNGDFDLCRKYLGRPFTLSGKVIAGNKLGRKLGFATANMHLDPEMMQPAYGIYVTSAKLDGGKERPAITNVGVRPTIGDNQELAETHIFDFSEDLYGTSPEIVFYEKLRAEQKFENIEAMQKQIQSDIAAARRWWFD
ncbi:MAG: bifunctional riboflavin kinase/FAD synthetase [Clostridiales Family XIII bacterium]|jgi:riboflavin kinase/FMN adenylyltransferase|nr:bifunctional riboflavin kinase/FAD synthetase [Clostridiales Family XIII bacterium]